MNKTHNESIRRNIKSRVCFLQVKALSNLMTFPAKPNAQSWTSSNYSADAFLVGLQIFYYGKVYFDYPQDMGSVTCLLI
jgi:hypothetical protein